MCAYNEQTANVMIKKNNRSCLTLHYQCLFFINALYKYSGQLCAFSE